MIAHVRRIVARAAGSLQGWNAAGNQATGQELVIDTGDGR